MLMLASIISASALAVAETEPNDATETATPIELNTDVTGKIESYRDRDCYVIIVPSDGYISVDFDITSPYVFSELFEVNILTGYGTLGGRNTYWPIGRVDGEMVTSTGIIGLRAGVYYVYISCGDSGSGMEYKMNVRYTETEHCEIESNQTMLTATEIELNESYKGSISDEDDQDWYCINVPENGYITVGFSHAAVNSSKNYWSIFMYEEDGTSSIDGKISKSPMLYISGKETETSIRIGLAAGTYYIKIGSGEFYTYNQEKFTYHSNVTYDLKVSYTKTELTELEPNSDAEGATPIKPNESYVGGIMKSSDEDWFAVELPQDGYITVSLENKAVSDLASVQIRICQGSRYTDINGYKKNNGADSRCWEIKANEFGETSMIGLRAGTYYIWLKSNYIITYSLAVNYTPSVFTEHEPNTERGNATSVELNKSYMGSNAYMEDEDWYSLHLTSARDLTLYFNHMAQYPSVSCWSVVLYGSDGKTALKTFDVKGNENGAWNIGTLSPERYYIKVTAGNQLQTDVYSFSVAEKHDCVGELNVTKAPGCTEDGEGERICSLCGAVFGREVISAVGHSFEGWITDVEATCYSSGKCHRQCTVCNTVEGDVIPQLNHKLGDWIIIRGNIIIPPIVKEQKCEYCGLTETTEDWGYVWVTVLAGIAVIGLCIGVVSYIKAYKNP